MYEIAQIQLPVTQNWFTARQVFLCPKIALVIFRLSPFIFEEYVHTHTRQRTNCHLQTHKIYIDHLSKCRRHNDNVVYRAERRTKSHEQRKIKESYEMKTNSIRKRQSTFRNELWRDEHVVFHSTKFFFLSLFLFSVYLFTSLVSLVHELKEKSMKNYISCDDFLCLFL